MARWNLTTACLGAVVLGLVVCCVGATVVVTSPAAGQEVVGNRFFNIAWFGAETPTVQVTLFRYFEGATQVVVQHNVPVLQVETNSTEAQGSYEWDVPFLQDHVYFIGVDEGPPYTRDAGAGSFGVSGNFSIVAPTTAAYVEAPGAGERWVANQPYTVKWHGFEVVSHVAVQVVMSSSTDPQADFDTYAFTTGDQQMAANSYTPNPVPTGDGQVVVTWPAGLFTSWEFPMRVVVRGVDSNGNAQPGYGIKTSEPIFTPGITVTSAASTFYTTFQHAVAWTSGHFESSVELTLIAVPSSGDAFFAQLTEQNNTGSGSWVLPYDLPSSSLAVSYFFRIHSKGNNNIFSEFQAVTVTPAITVSSPAALATAGVGTGLTIEWQQPAFADEVALHLYTGVGLAHYQSVVGAEPTYGAIEVLTVAASVSGTSFTWTVPADAVPSNEYVVVATRASDGTVYGLSATYFEITAPDACDGVSCSNGGTCSSGACTCTTGFAGKFCEYDAASVINGFTVQINSYVLPLPNETAVTHTAASSEACAELCLQDPTCASFDFGHAWTNFASTCTLSPFQTQAQAGPRFGPSVSFSFYERRTCSDVDCLACDAADTCLRCSDTTFLHEGGCVASCPAGFEPTSLVAPMACQACPAGQAKGDGDSTCTPCTGDT